MTRKPQDIAVMSKSRLRREAVMRGEDIAGGQEKARKPRKPPMTHLRDCIETYNASEGGSGCICPPSRFIVEPVGPASVQDQERPIAHVQECGLALMRWGCTCRLYPPAPPIAKAEEPPAWALEAARMAVHFTMQQVALGLPVSGVERLIAPVIAECATAALAESADRG